MQCYVLCLLVYSAPIFAVVHHWKMEKIVNTSDIVLHEAQYGMPAKSMKKVTKALQQKKGQDDIVFVKPHTVSEKGFNTLSGQSSDGVYRIKITFDGQACYRVKRGRVKSEALMPKTAGKELCSFDGMGARVHVQVFKKEKIFTQETFVKVYDPDVKQQVMALYISGKQGNYTVSLQ